MRAEWNFEDLSPPTIRDSIPMLILMSKDDPVIPPRTRDHLKNYYPHAKIHEFSSGGHFPYLTQPHEYAQEILTFLEDLT